LAHQGGRFPRNSREHSYVFKKGTILRENKIASANSNRPRNNAFVYIIAGKLVRGDGIRLISVDGTRNTEASQGPYEQEPSPDIVLSFQDNLIQIECKRPMSAETLDENAQSAFCQLTKKQPSPWGVIAIDASRIMAVCHP
jgi:hypothetical protein